MILKQRIIEYLKNSLKKLSVEEKEINLDHPNNPNFGDYATSIALKLAKKTIKGNFLENIEFLLKNVDRKNFENFKNSLPVAKISNKIRDLLKAETNLVYLKPRVYAKIRGWWKHIRGHKEITPFHFFLLPLFINQPTKIYQDKTFKNRYNFIFTFGHLGTIVIEITEKSKMNEIVTMFYIKEKQLEKLKKIFEAKKKTLDAGTATSRFSPPSEKLGLPAAEFSGLRQQVQSYINKLMKKNQEDILSYQEKKNPLQWAQEIVYHLPKDPFIEKVEVVRPGFINFWVSKKFLLSQAQNIVCGKWQFPHFHLGKNKKIMMEFAHPNTHKLFHIGHLRNITSGEALCRILEAVGNKVIRANYQGDVGLHIAKCLYQVKSQKLKVKSLKTIEEKVKFLGEAYAKGNKAYETSKKAKNEIIEINRMIYEQDDKILPLWKKTRQWSLDYFNQIYQRVGTKFDRFYFESEMADRGKQLAFFALKKGILEKSQGAIVFSGKKYGLDTRVFVNNLGFPTYEGKELALAEKEFSEFGEIDKCIHLVGPEQTSFFKVTFKVEELLNEKKYKNKQIHLIGGFVRLKYGKMSSREGKVIEGPWLLDEAKRRILERYRCQEEIAEVLAIASVKYSFLKNHISADIDFDFDESISLEGNSGPYLLYTYVRTQSVLKKTNLNNLTTRQFGNLLINKEESDLFHLFYRFPEVVFEAGKNFSPNLITNYLFDLAQKYNLFYQKHPILKAEKKKKEFRLLLTKTTGRIIKKGLNLLGIETVEKM